MRVISGKYKGKKLNGFNIDGTRPTMDRVKESIFSMIQNHIKDSTVLDLFSGSGSLAIESISNGAKSAYLIDNNIISIQVINNNIQGIDGDIHVIKSDYIDALKLLKSNKFDIVFLDPPYDLNLISDCIARIKEYDMLASNGIIVCEYENENIVTDLKLYKEKKYGTKNVKIYKKEN